MKAIEKPLTHRIDVRRTKRGQILYSYPISENEIEEYKEKFKSYIVKIRKPRK